jgi:hypothetical protein
MEWLSSLFPDGIPDGLIAKLLSLEPEIVFTDSRSTVGADGIVEIIQSFRMGSDLEVFKTAVLAGDWDNHVSPESL